MLSVFIPICLHKKLLLHKFAAIITYLKKIFYSKNKIKKRRALPGSLSHLVDKADLTPSPS